MNIDLAKVNQIIATEEIQEVKEQMINEFANMLSESSDLVPGQYSHDADGFEYHLPTPEAAAKYAEDLSNQDGAVANLTVKGCVIIGSFYNKVPETLNNAEFNLLMADVFNFTFKTVLGNAPTQRKVAEPA